MCLFVGNKISLVAEKDIKVYKLLLQKDGGYVTPYQRTSVALNKVMKANKVTELYSEFYNKYQINGGAIHAYTSIPEGRLGLYFEATIPAGTKYYLQDDFKEIAAEQLYISDKIVTKPQQSPDFNTILTDYLKAVFNMPEYRNKDDISIGYIRLSTGEYVNPLEDFDKTKAIGIVAFFNEDKPVVVALESKLLPCLTDYEMKNKVYSQIIEDNYLSDFAGKQHCNDISSGCDYDTEKFNAINYCLNYETEGTKKGDWYLGATGEMVKVSQNVGIINAVLELCNIGTPIDFGYHWTSSEWEKDGSSYVWYCYIEATSCNISFFYTFLNFSVRPLAIENQE